MAGITVALIAVPQAMAYATLAGVNPIYGLYAAIIPAIVASFFGSSNHVVTGPTNTIALATSGVLIAVASESNYLEYVFAIAILSGVLKLLLGSFKLGFIIRYFSNSVLTGFLSGAAVLIMVNQLPKLLGLTSSTRHDLIGVALHMIRNFSDTNLLVLGLGIGGIVFLLMVKKRLPKFPSALFILFLSGLIVHYFGLAQEGVRLLKDMSTVGLSEMRFDIPGGVFTFDNIGMILTGAGAVALLSLVEAVSVAKSIAIHTGQRIDANREFVGQGLASIVGGLFHGIPTSGSLTRSAVNFEGGAATRAASGLSGVFVLLLLLIFKDWISFIPEVCLAVIVIVSALNMIDFHHIAITWRGRSISKIVIGVTFLSVLFLPLQISIYIGVGLSIVFYLYESSRLELSYLVLNGNNKFSEKSIQEVFDTMPKVAVINVEGPLFFGAVQDLEDKITDMIDAGIKTIVLRLRRSHMIASSGISTLEILIQRAKQKGGRIKLSGVTEEVMQTLHACKLDEEIRETNIFKATEIPYESTRLAVESCN